MFALTFQELCHNGEKKKYMKRSNKSAEGNSSQHHTIVKFSIHAMSMKVEPSIAFDAVVINSP
jgi:hypothetical protein